MSLKDESVTGRDVTGRQDLVEARLKASSPPASPPRVAEAGEADAQRGTGPEQGIS